MELTYEGFINEYGGIVGELTRNLDLTSEDYDDGILSDNFFKREDVSGRRAMCIVKDTKHLFEKYSKQIKEKKQSIE